MCCVDATLHVRCATPRSWDTGAIYDASGRFVRNPGVLYLITRFQAIAGVHTHLALCAAAGAAVAAAGANALHQVQVRVT